MKSLKKICVCLLAGALLWLTLWVVAGIYLRDWHGARPVSTLEIQQARERAMQWMAANESSILENGNSALWWMVRDSASVGGDPRIQHLYQSYLSNWMRESDYSRGWKRLVLPESQEAIDFEDLASLRPYQHFFMFGATCEPRLREWPGVNRNLTGGACPLPLLWSFKDSACSTHQMMGLILLKARPCEQAGDLRAVTDSTREALRQQIWWDFAVRDIYIQRALVLWWAGHGDDVPADVVSRIVRAQREDGGWNDHHVLYSGPSFYLALGGRFGLTTTPVPSEFHATAQALLLFDLVLSKASQSPAGRAKNNAP
jgi:hypothetical protein